MTREHQLQEMKMHVHKEAYVSPATRRRIHHLSPLVAPSELLKKFPCCGIMASELDPLLDDSIMFARRLHMLGKQADVRIKVAPLLPHGWLNMYFTGDPGSMAASTEVLCWMKQMLKNGLAPKDAAAGAGGSQHASAAGNGAAPMSATDALVKLVPAPPPARCALCTSPRGESSKRHRPVTFHTAGENGWELGVCACRGKGKVSEWPGPCSDVVDTRGGHSVRLWHHLLSARQ